MDEEILLCLRQMNVKLTSMKKITLDFNILEKFIEYFAGKNFEVISLPRLSGVDCFLYPELHEESILVLTAHRVLQKIFFSAGLNDFSLSDYLTSNWERFRKIVSGIINLARFREEISKILSKFSYNMSCSQISIQNLIKIFCSNSFHFSWLNGILNGQLDINFKKNENYLELTLNSLIKKSLTISCKKSAQNLFTKAIKKSKNTIEKQNWLLFDSNYQKKKIRSVNQNESRFKLDLKILLENFLFFFKIYSRFLIFKNLNKRLLIFFEVIFSEISYIFRYIERDNCCLNLLENLSSIYSKRFYYFGKKLKAFEKKCNKNQIKKKKSYFKKNSKILKRFFFFSKDFPFLNIALFFFYF